MVNKIKCEFENCENYVHPATAKSCAQYEELGGKIYCKKHRDEILRKNGYVCIGCGETTSKSVKEFSESRYGKQLCRKCQNSGNIETGDVIDVQALIPVTESYPIVKPAVGVDAAVDAWKMFQELKRRIKEPEDITVIRDKEYLGKSFWRRMSTFFNLTDSITKCEIKENDDGRIISAYYEIEVIAPNGRKTTGIGYCDRNERSFVHAGHDIRATAHTRAKNRGISDMVAGGEVSKEEMEADSNSE